MTSLGKIRLKKSQKFAVCRFYAADIREAHNAHRFLCESKSENMLIPHGIQIQLKWSHDIIQ